MSATCRIAMTATAMMRGWTTILRSKPRLFGKFATSHYNVRQAGALGDAVGESLAAKDYTVTAIANFTHGFSPTLLTELRLGYNRYRTDVNGVD